MTLTMFKEMTDENTKLFFTNKNSALELAFEIDDPLIFDNCTCGEFFNYKNVKVFIDKSKYRAYKKLITHI